MTLTLGVLWNKVLGVHASRVSPVFRLTCCCCLSVVVFLDSFLFCLQVGFFNGLVKYNQEGVFQSGLYLTVLRAKLKCLFPALRQSGHLLY